MVLKEAFEYQNFISDLISIASNYLDNRSFITETVQKHQKTKVNKDATDEEIKVSTAYSEMEFEPNDLLNLMSKLFDEKYAVSAAIKKAKDGLDFDVDSAVGMNKLKQKYLNTLSAMGSMKNTERDGQATDYKFDITGEQKPYKYPVKEVTTIRYDRNSVKGLEKKTRRETSETSMKIDAAMVTTVVDFEPKYEIGSTLEDVVLQ